MFNANQCRNKRRRYGVARASRRIGAALVSISFSIAPALAATDTNFGPMFSAMDVAFSWVQRLFLIGAVLSIASYAITFFGYTGEAKEQRLDAAKTRIKLTCIACAAVYLIPAAIAFGKDIAKDLRWTSGGDYITTHPDATKDDLDDALGGNHIIIPANTDDGYADVNEEDNEEGVDS